ncbi:MAG: hypothetical protein FWF44_08380, partial [Defluviitaleaceae bacterium]|nr:hypothetical protein [Defluviitaleaceae bacterium]
RWACTKENDWNFWGHGGLGTPIVVFNPLAWSRAIPVQLGRPAANITDDLGVSVPVQRVRASRTNQADKWDSLFLASVPAMGWRTYWVYLESCETTEVSNELAAGEDFIENEFLRLTIDPNTGYIAGLYDKSTGREILAGPGAVPFVIDVEHCDTWGHSVFSFRDEFGRFARARITLLESGPVRTVLRMESFYGASVLRQDFILYAGAKQVEIRARLDWRERFKLLKLSFPVRVSGTPRAVCDIPFGHIERRADGREEFGQMWFDGSDENGGLTVLNDGKYAFDMLGGDMRMTVANSSLYADHFAGEHRDELCEYMDQGVQEFRYALRPHAGGCPWADIAKAAISLNTEETHIAETYHAGPLPLCYSGIEVAADNVIVTAVKPAQDGSGIIVRAYEAGAGDTETELRLSFLDRSFRARFPQNGVKTFRVQKGTNAPVVECDFMENAIFEENKEDKVFG